MLNSHRVSRSNIFKGLRLTAGRRPSNNVWLMVWEDWAEILRANSGGLCWTEAGIMCSACLYGSSLGLCWSWAHVEPSWAHLVHMLDQVGPMLSHRAHLGPILAQVGPMLGYVGLILGPCWAYVGPRWAILGAMLGPCLGHLCWNDLKMPIFAPRPPGPPSGSQKPRKNRSFVTSPRWNPLPPKGPKSLKTMFF